MVLTYQDYQQKIHEAEERVFSFQKLPSHEPQMQKPPGSTQSRAKESRYT